MKKYTNKVNSCLQIGDNDLTGNKYNGHDLHLYLRENNISASHLVRQKDSNDTSTFEFLNSNTKDDFMSNLIHHPLFINSDIIHLHLIHNINFDLMYLPVISALKPVVWTIHDPWAITGHCVHPFDCEKWRTHCRNCERLDIPFQISFDNTSLEFQIKLDAIRNSQIIPIVASEIMKQKLEQSPIWLGKKIYKIPFGINQEIFKPADIKESKKKLGIDENMNVLFFRAEDTLYKGLDILKRLLDKIEKHSVIILTVDGKGLLDSYKNKFEIREYGWLKDDKKLAELFQACDVFLMPSRQEAFGMMAIEAMSCAKPVIALKGTALPETINAPQCGIAVDEDNYIQEVLRLLKNPDEIIGRGQKSLQFAKENYNHKIYIQRIIDVYNSALSEHHLTEHWKSISDQIKINTNIKPVKHNNEIIYQKTIDKNFKKDLTKFSIKKNKYFILSKISFGKQKKKYKDKYIKYKEAIDKASKYIM